MTSQPYVTYTANLNNDIFIKPIVFSYDTKSLFEKWKKKLDERVYMSIGFYPNMIAPVEHKIKQTRYYFAISGPPTLLHKGITWKIEDYIKQFYKLKCFKKDKNTYLFYCYNYSKLIKIQDFVHSTKQSNIYKGSTYTMEIFKWN